MNEKQKYEYMKRAAAAYGRGAVDRRAARALLSTATVESGGTPFLRRSGGGFWGSTPEEQIAAARRRYVEGKIEVEEFEAELDRVLRPDA